MRPKPDKDEAIVVGLLINQKEVGAEVAIAKSAPFPCQRMVEEAARQVFILRQQADGIIQMGVELPTEHP